MCLEVVHRADIAVRVGEQLVDESATWRHPSVPYVVGKNDGNDEEAVDSACSN